MSIKNEKDYIISTTINSTTLVEDADPNFKLGAPIMTSTGPSYRLPQQIMTTVDKKSINGLECSKPELNHMINKPMVVHKLTEGKGMPGELDHPDKETASRVALSSVCMKNAAIMIRNFEFAHKKGNEHLCSEVTTLANRNGLILANILELGFGIGYSMRARATLIKKDGVKFKDIDLTAYDAVYNPSNRDSWSVLEGVSEVDILNGSGAIKEIMRNANSMGNLKFGVSAQEISNFITESVRSLSQQQNAGARKIQMMESIMRSGAALDLRDLGDNKLQSIQESVEYIQESSRLDFDPTHVIILEGVGAGEVLYVSETTSARVAIANSARAELSREIRNRLKR